MTPVIANFRISSRQNLNTPYPYYFARGIVPKAFTFRDFVVSGRWKPHEGEAKLSVHCTSVVPSGLQI